MSRRQHRAREQEYDVVHAKPVFAVGGTVSGYGSLGSAESLTGDKSIRDNSGGAKNNMSQELQSLSQAKSSFKSTFAKELHQENIQRNSPSWRHSSYRSSFIDEVISEDSIGDNNGNHTAVTSNDVSEYVRVKRENEVLKRRLSAYNKEDEKYKKLEFEIEQLTWQLGKVRMIKLVIMCNKVAVIKI